MKQRIIAVAALVCMTVAAIWGSRFEMTGASEELTGLSLFEKKETINFWYADERLTDYVNNAAVVFGEQRDVHVLPQLVSESEYVEAVNDATLHSDHVPDVYLISNDSLEKAYLAGLASEAKDQAGVLDDAHFPQAALSAVTYQGKLVAYPLYYDTTALVYNRTYLEEWLRQQAQAGEEEAWDEDAADGEDADIPVGEDADGEPMEDVEEADPEAQALEEARIAKLLESGIPQTVDDILYIGDTFDLPEGVDGIMKWDVSDIFYNYWIVGNYMVVGGDAGDDGSKMDLQNGQIEECLEVYKALNQFFSIESKTVTYESVIQDFMDGKIVFTIASADVAARLREAKADGSLAFEYGITTMPDMGDRLGSRSVSVTGAVAVNGYSEHKELANAFAAFLTCGYSKDLYARTGRPAAYLGSDEGEGLEAFREEYASSIPLPKMMATSNLWIQLEVLFSKVWNGGEVSELLAELDAQIQSQLGAVN